MDPAIFAAIGEGFDISIAKATKKNERAKQRRKKIEKKYVAFYY
jgi:hypothetical protein